MSTRGETYEFGPFLLEPDEPRLLRDRAVVAIEHEALHFLLFMVSEPGRLLRKDTLIRRFWSGSADGEAQLGRTVSEIRRALGDPQGLTYVQAVGGVGFRFRAPVRWLPPTKAHEAATQKKDADK